jgi:hypothetical protein
LLPFNHLTYKDSEMIESKRVIALLMVASAMAFLVCGLAWVGVAQTQAYAANGKDAYSVQYTAHFSRGELSFDKVMGYDLVNLKDGDFLLESGEPMLPSKELRIALPAGMAVTSVEVVNTTEEEIPGDYNIFPAQPPTKIGNSAGDAGFVPPDNQIYTSSQPYPSDLVRFVNQSDLAGQSMAEVVVFPLRYVPVQKRLTYCTTITFEIKGSSGYECGDYLSPNISEDGRRAYEQRVKDMVANPEAVQLVSSMKASTAVLPPGPFAHVIITSSTFAPYFQPLVDWHTQKGVRDTVITIDWIYAHYAGADSQKVRSFIIDANSTWGTTYFLLGGEDETVPFCYRTYYNSENTPSDEYYSDYDNDWVMEVFVGRVPVSYMSEATTFVDKVLKYEKDPPLSDYLLNALLIGMDLDASTPSELLKENIRNTAPIPAYFNVSRVYDSYGGNHRDSVVYYLNQGQNLVNHSDHSNTNVMGTGDFHHGWAIYDSDVDALTNTDKTCNVVSVGCLPNHMDGTECIAEHFVTYNPNRAGLSFTGNTRDGYYTAGNPYVLSSALDKQWWVALFTRNKYNLGQTIADAKQNFANSQAIEKHCEWSFNLLGEPEMPLYTASPSILSVTFPDSVSMEPQTVDVYVAVSGSPKSGAKVCLSKGNEVYVYGSTQADGWVHLSISPFAPGDLLITATAQNCLPFQDTIRINSSLYLDQFSFDDAAGGNGNGRPEGGETVKLYFTLRNEWKTLNGASVTATADEPGITFNDDYSYLGNLSLGGSADNAADPMEFQVEEDLPVTLVRFTLHIHGNSGSDSTYLVKDAWAGKSIILLVDDDEGTDPSSNVESYYTSVLDSLRAGYDTWDRMSHPDTAYNFSDYEILIWFTGNHRTSMFYQADVESLMSFLDRGGRLFLTSQDAAEVLSASSDPWDTLFLKHYLHTGYDGDNPKYMAIGSSGDELSDSMFIYPNYTVVNQTSKDNLVPDAEAEPVLYYTVGGPGQMCTPSDSVAGIKYPGDSFKVVMFGFGFESIRDDGGYFQCAYTSTQRYVMQKVLEWLKAPFPTLEVTSPNGGEVWYVADTTDILWQSISFDQKVKIELSTDAGSNWTILTDSAANTGTYALEVPNTPSDSCLVRISDASDGVPSAVSDGYFSIANYVPGDVNADKVVDVGDVVYLINYLFKGGPAPNPMAAGDANGDCVVDVGDVVYMINYLFKHGNPPVAGCA